LPVHDWQTAPQKRKNGFLIHVISPKTEKWKNAFQVRTSIHHETTKKRSGKTVRRHLSFQIYATGKTEKRKMEACPPDRPSKKTVFNYRIVEEYFLKNFKQTKDRPSLISLSGHRETYVPLDLCKLPTDIGCHLPNGHVELVAADTAPILKWVEEKIEKASADKGVIVEFVSWCPPWLAMSLGAQFHKLMMEGLIKEVHYFTDRGGQHNIIDKTGIVGIPCPEMAS
jgi:hypothetical protein